MNLNSRIAQILSLKIHSVIKYIVRIINSESIFEGGLSWEIIIWK